MAILDVNATRSELNGLRQRLDAASRGHKILKDKQDGLLGNFISLIKKNNALRQEVEAKLKRGMQSLAIAKSLTHEAFLDEIMATPAYNVELDIDKENLLSVRVPKMYFNTNNAAEDTKGLEYGYLQTSGDLDQTFQEFYDILPKMLELAEIEKAAQLLAKEIESTRRRVNALEERTIPDLKETIHSIELTLDENERAEITRLMKIKDFDKDENEL